MGGSLRSPLPGSLFFLFFFLGRFWLGSRGSQPLLANRSSLSSRHSLIARLGGPSGVHLIPLCGWLHGSIQTTSTPTPERVAARHGIRAWACSSGPNNKPFPRPPRATRRCSRAILIFLSALSLYTFSRRVRFHLCGGPANPTAALFRLSLSLFPVSH